MILRGFRGETHQYRTVGTSSKIWGGGKQRMGAVCRIYLSLK